MLDLNKKIDKILKKEKQRLVIFDVENCSTCHSSTHQHQQLLNIKSNMKEKSLEELTKRFMQLLLDRTGQLITLDQVAHQLGVERRKIYDIINIMESIHLIKREDKNIIYLQSVEPLQEFIDEVQRRDSREQQGGKKEKQLEYLAQGFIHLFNKQGTQMSLEHIAACLAQPQQSHSIHQQQQQYIDQQQQQIDQQQQQIDQQQQYKNEKRGEEQRLKTRVRRLYDIANVFKSIGLVEKVKLQKNKPGYKWNGMSNIYKIIQSEGQYRVSHNNKQNNQNRLNNNYDRQNNNYYKQNNNYEQQNRNYDKQNNNQEQQKRQDKQIPTCLERLILFQQFTRLMNQPINIVNQPLNILNQPLNIVNQPINIVNQPINIINQALDLQKINQQMQLQQQQYQQYQQQQQQKQLRQGNKEDKENRPIIIQCSQEQVVKNNNYISPHKQDYGSQKVFSTHQKQNCQQSQQKTQQIMSEQKTQQIMSQQKTLQQMNRKHISIMSEKSNFKVHKVTSQLQGNSFY